MTKEGKKIVEERASHVKKRIRQDGLGEASGPKLGVN